ncbi:thiamine biosynthesis lipoprotein [Dyadobacter jejuensis]|uniref:FAD:protein FMN transferase n=2 Tax=Dyadobacter jejuensis TaxID=1082580 RepID=A0A316AQW6_9BACT|nr:thiamine biosynthesis lipoprotein [Dyadobacter jejuensis]
MLGRAAAGDIPLVTLEGETQGTTYHLKYYDQEARNYKGAIDSILLAFDRCLSLYRPDSEISRFNRSDQHTFESPFFYPILLKSREVYEQTQGAFDPTIFPLVEAYGFGPNRKHQVSEVILQEILPLVNFDRIHFDSISVRKEHPGIRLDFNGIAQGYSVDLLAMFLEKQGIHRYMVEIGGEIRCQGKKENGKPWMAGIEDPTRPSRLIATLPLLDRSLTTSGNYRNHFVHNGRLYNHIINPKTGDMESSNILSVTVLANDAITADGYDTPLFLMGVAQSIRFIRERKDLEVYLVYTDDQGQLQTYVSPGLKEIIQEKR